MSFIVKWKKSLLLFFVLLSINVKTIYSQDNSYSWDFSNCEIKDILYAVSVDTGISIVPDDTVTGKGDFQFSGGNFNEAFDSFLRRCRLYVCKIDNVWTVSKFKCLVKDERYYVDAYDLYPNELLEKISENVKWTITYDSLPNQKISVHFKDLTKEELVAGLSKQFGQWDVSETSKGFHFAKKNNYNNYEILNSNINISVSRKNNSDDKVDADNIYCVDVKESDFFDILEQLFSAGKNYGDNYNYCIISSNNNKVERTLFHGDDFISTLNTVCGQNSHQAVYKDDIFYIIDDDDIKENLVIGEKNWERFSLDYINVDDFLPLLNKKIGNIELISLPDKDSFLCNCNSDTKKIISNFIKQIDIKNTVYLVNLKYLKPDELLEFLPPNINKNNLFLADNNSRLYFRGTDEAYKNLLEQVEVVDKPVKRISYDLLIIQCDENSQNAWSSSMGAKQLKLGERSNLSAMLGSVMGFNLNVVSAFGLNFALDLQNSIEENSARVFADTTLHGVSGKKISFQNTNTYRYRDNNIDPETGKPVFSGVTKEIITGIKIDVYGWVSGDGMITSTVTASISRQGVDTSGSTGNPPATSEKLITTEVTGKSEEPVVLSGLLLSADTDSDKRSPLISKIPLFGKLFKNENHSKEKSQMIIYLVPHVEELNTENYVSDNEKLYTDDWFENEILKIIKKIKEE